MSHSVIKEGILDNIRLKPFQNNNESLVVIKVIDTTGFPKKSLDAREIQIMEQMNHDNVVHMISHGQIDKKSFFLLWNSVTRMKLIKLMKKNKTFSKNELRFWFKMVSKRCLVFKIFQHITS